MVGLLVIRITFEITVCASVVNMVLINYSLCF